MFNERLGFCVSTQSSSCLSWSPFSSIMTITMHYNVSIYSHWCFWKFGPSNGFSSRPQSAFRETEILVEIASFERRLRGAAQIPLAMTYPFRTLTRTRTDAERDIREDAKVSHVEEEFFRFCCIFTSEAPVKFHLFFFFQTIVRNVLNGASAYSRAFVLLDVCKALTSKTRKGIRGAAPTRECLRRAVLTPLALICWAPRRER